MKYTETVAADDGLRHRRQGRDRHVVDPHRRAAARDRPRLTDVILLRRWGRGSCSSSAGAARQADAAGDVVHGRRRPFHHPVRPRSHLPAAIRTRDDDNIDGDSNLRPGAERLEGGRRRADGADASRIGSTASKWRTSRQRRRRRIAPIAATPRNVPDAVKAGAKAPATGSNVPYQWVHPPLFLTRFLDSDGIIVPDGGACQAGRARRQRLAGAQAAPPTT